jgi:hypothetical protein
MSSGRHAARSWRSPWWAAEASEPGEWTDDSSMAIAIAEIADTGRRKVHSQSQFLPCSRGRYGRTTEKALAVLIIKILCIKQSEIVLLSVASMRPVWIAARIATAPFGGARRHSRPAGEVARRAKTGR